jgi:hypothetical protein
LETAKSEIGQMALFLECLLQPCLHVGKMAFGGGQLVADRWTRHDDVAGIFRVFGETPACCRSSG